MDPAPGLSRLALVQATLFAAGIVALVLSVLANAPRALLVSGPCLFASGVLIGLGTQLTLRGPLGALIRVALGGPRVKLQWLRAAVWTTVGVLVTLYGIARISDPAREPPVPGPTRQPTASVDVHVRGE